MRKFFINIVFTTIHHLTVTTNNYIKMAPIKSPKIHTVVNEVLDERGRLIEPQEFNYLMDQCFTDRYDNRRLCLALLYTTGLRLQDGLNTRLAWFNEDLTMLKMSQCKGTKKIVNGIRRIKKQARYVPLPDWLTIDLQNYIKYRLAVGLYVGEDIEDFRLFPKLKRASIYQFFAKLRERKSKEIPWINDVWRIEKTYDAQDKLIKIRKHYRIAPHAGRANYVTSAYNSTGKDIKATQILSGHQKIENVQRYIRVNNLMKLKTDLKRRFMDPLTSIQSIPILSGQKQILDFA